MLLLADENFPRDAVHAMRNAGHDVIWIRESFPGMSDTHILQMAVVQSRILVTFDKDFGELAFKSKLPATSGVVLFRIRKLTPQMLSQRIGAFLAARDDWQGHFSVVEEDRIRMTVLPGYDEGTLGRVGPA